MLVVDDTVLSEELFTEHFCCHLAACSGCCCVEGDAGAPLDEEEVGILEDVLPKVLPYMSVEGREAVAQSDVFDYDEEGHLVTSLIHDRECVFVRYEGDVAYCAIEKAYLMHKISFRKPISCHLYPIRIEKRNCYELLEYHRWDICHAACEEGNRQGITVFQYLKNPLVRKYGPAWYRKVEKMLALREQEVSKCSFHKDRS